VEYVDKFTCEDTKMLHSRNGGERKNSAVSGRTVLMCFPARTNVLCFSSTGTAHAGQSRSVRWRFGEMRGGTVVILLDYEGNVPISGFDHSRLHTQLQMRTK
jgi:hypothetical protein